MLRLLLPVFESVLMSALPSVEFKAWLIAVAGPGSVVALESIRAHAADECGRKGW